MRTHELKTWPSCFAAVLTGEKRFEARLNDRDFSQGDILKLMEYDPASDGNLGPKGYTGQEQFMRVGFILHGGQFGIEKGHCVMSITRIPEAFT